MHTNYRLTYCTKNSVWKTYFGETEVYATQTPQEACDVRLEWHLQYPKACMDGGVQDTFEIKPYGKLLSHRNALCQEAIDTAVGLETESTVRGACFSKRVLTVMLEGCAAQLRKTTKNMTGQAARNAVFKYAQTLDETHPLACHLEHKSYYEKKPERPAKLVQKRSGRSGKPGGETRERQLERGEYKHGDKTHRRLQRGQNVSKRILKSNENRKTPRKSGSRKKHKQSLTLALSVRKKNRAPSSRRFRKKSFIVVPLLVLTFAVHLRYRLPVSSRMFLFRKSNSLSLLVSCSSQFSRFSGVFR